MNQAYSLAEVEQEIYDTYQWFHKEGGVTVYPREEGNLGALWALHDLLVDDEKTRMTAEEIEVEYGRAYV